MRVTTEDWPLDKTECSKPITNIRIDGTVVHMFSGKYCDTDAPMLWELTRQGLLNLSYVRN